MRRFVTGVLFVLAAATSTVDMAAAGNQAPTGAGKASLRTRMAQRKAARRKAPSSRRSQRAAARKAFRNLGRLPAYAYDFNGQRSDARFFLSTLFVPLGTGLTAGGILHSVVDSLPQDSWVTQVGGATMAAGSGAVTWSKTKSHAVRDWLAVAAADLVVQEGKHKGLDRPVKRAYEIRDGKEPAPASVDDLRAILTPEALDWAIRTAQGSRQKQLIPLYQRARDLLQVAP